MLGEGGIGGRGGDGGEEWRSRSGWRWWWGVAAPAADQDKEELEMPLVKGFIGSRRKEIKN
jgi:hypothetical protein